MGYHKSTFYHLKDLAFNSSPKNLGEFSPRLLTGKVVPKNLEDLKREVLKAKNEGQIIHTISSGKNWGLGSYLPSAKSAKTIDLSNLNQIRKIDFENGIAVVEAGVTQGKLAEVLQDSRFMLNVTSSSPESSIVGNALEKGVGFYRSRDKDILGFEVLLPSGELATFGNGWTGKNHHSGIDLSRLFFQSNLGIVTAAAVHLIPKVHHIATFRIDFYESDFQQFIAFIKEQYHSGTLTSISRIYSEAAQTAYGTKGQEGKLFRCYGAVNNKFGQLIVASMLEEASILGFKVYQNFKNDQFDPLEKAVLRCYNGDPTLNLGLLQATFGVSEGEIDSKSNIGWISFLPIVSFSHEPISQAFAIVNQMQNKYGIHCSVTLNILNHREVDFVIGIWFSRACTNQKENAHRALDKFHESFQNIGCTPYRYDIDHMINHFETLSSSEKYFSQSIKDLFDPSGTIDPCRYIIKQGMV